MTRLDTLAHDIARYGIDRFETEVIEFADAAYRRGVAPTLAAILADPTGPAVSRERAFGRLAAAVLREVPISLDSVA
ncbi:MAG: hypothetical protein WD532_10175 [Acidimicrobiia bacterium]